MSTLSQRAASVALGQRPSPNDGHGKLGRDEMHRHSPLTTVRFEREIIGKPWQTRVRSQQQQRTDTVQKVDPASFVTTLTQKTHFLRFLWRQLKKVSCPLSAALGNAAIEYPGTMNKISYTFVRRI